MFPHIHCYYIDADIESTPISFKIVIIIHVSNTNANIYHNHGGNVWSVLPAHVNRVARWLEALCMNSMAGCQTGCEEMCVTLVNWQTLVL